MRCGWVVHAVLALTVTSTQPSFSFSAAAPPAAPLVWKEMETGAARAEIQANDGTTTVHLLRFDMAYFRPQVVVGSGRPPRPATAAALVQRGGAIAAVNGGFFDEQLRPLGLRIASGETRVPLRTRVDWGVLIIRDRHASIVHTRDYASEPKTPHAGSSERINDAIQVGPRLLVDGVPLKLKPQVARRTAVALDRDGRTFTLVVTDAPMEANALAAQLAACGFESALMLDGGPSTQLALHLGLTKMDLPGGYPVPDLLVIFRAGKAGTRQPPSAAPRPADAAPAVPRSPLPSPQSRP